MSRQAYDEMADAVRALTGEIDPGRPRKRPRLESVVPALRRAAQGHQGRICPPLWVSGMATRAQPRGGRGAGGWQRGQQAGYWRPRGLGFRRGRGRGNRGFHEYGY